MPINTTQNPSTARNLQRWLTLHPVDSASFLTLIIAYLIIVIDSEHLNFTNFSLLTLLNLLCGVLLWRINMQPHLTARQRSIDMVLLGLLTFFSGLLILSGLEFQYLLYFVTIANYFTNLRLAYALTGSIVLYGGVLITFSLGDNWQNQLMGALSVLAGFIFVSAFSLSNRLLKLERERSSQFLSQLEISNQELEEAHQQLKQYAHEIEELATARERTRMARDIHDTLGHYLTIITIQLETISKLQERDPTQARKEVEEARRVAAQCMQEVRNAVSALRPTGIAQLNLKEALIQLGNEFHNGAPDTTLTLDLETPLPALSAELQLAIYRAAQESLTNVRKHAQATRVLLRLRFEDEVLELVIRDNGQGQPTAQPPAQPGGFGLTGLRERFELLGGQVIYGPAEPEGYRVTVRIHIPKSHNTLPSTSETPAREHV